MCLEYSIPAFAILNEVLSLNAQESRQPRYSWLPDARPQ